MRHVVIYIGGPQDGLREWREESKREVEVLAYTRMTPDTPVPDEGSSEWCVVNRHHYIKRPVGRDEYGREVFVAIHEPMLSRA